MELLKEKTGFLFRKEYWMNAFSFRFGISFFVLLVLALAMYPASLYLPQETGYENSWFENGQLGVLLFTMALCFVKKIRKTEFFPMFLFIMLVVFALAIRETNAGKTLFYPDPVRPNRFLHWDQIWYGPYVLPFWIVYVLGTAAYFIRKKVYLLILDTWRLVKFPAASLLMLLGTAAAGSVIDKATKNLVLEEGVELIFYLALTQIIWYYPFRLAKLPTE